MNEKIRIALMAYRCQHTLDADENALPLVDVLSPHETTEEGKAEIELLTDYLDAILGESKEGMGMAEGLKPCPFCGGAAEALGPDKHDDEWLRAYAGCVGECCARTAPFGTKAEAITAWNRRHPQGG